MDPVNPSFGKMLCAMPHPVVDEDANPNKRFPVMRGLLDYFPDACLDVANASLVGNEQHNPGEHLHWAREKSQDEADACIRHLMKRGSRDSDGVRHSAKAAWRALANLQREIEAERQPTLKARTVYGD